MKTVDCSVVIPVFNSEKTIASCLDSFELDKDWKYDIEIIIINDGSTDDSQQIITNYIERFLFCRAINIENNGVSYARNIGIKESCGRYILFVDSDDTVNRKDLDTAIQIADTTNCDMVISDYVTIDLNQGYRKNAICNAIHNKILDRKYIENELFKKIFTKKSSGLVNLWNKLYKRKTIEENNIFFDIHQTYGEDLLFNLMYYDVAVSIFVTDNLIYNYSINGKYGYKKKDYSYSLINVFNNLKFYNAKYGTFTKDDEEYITFKTNFIFDIIHFIKNKYIETEKKVKLLKRKEVNETILFMLKFSKPRTLFSKRELLSLWLINIGYYKFAIKIMK